MADSFMNPTQKVYLVAICKAESPDLQRNACVWEREFMCDHFNIPKDSACVVVFPSVTWTTWSHMGPEGLSHTHLFLESRKRTSDYLRVVTLLSPVSRYSPWLIKKRLSFLSERPGKNTPSQGLMCCSALLPNSYKLHPWDVNVSSVENSRDFSSTSSSSSILIS